MGRKHKSKKIKL